MKTQTKHPLRIGLLAHSREMNEGARAFPVAYDELLQAITARGDHATIAYASDAGIRTVSDPALSLDASAVFERGPGCPERLVCPEHTQAPYHTFLWLQSQAFDVVFATGGWGVLFYALTAKVQGLAFADTTFCVDVSKPTLLRRHEAQTPISELGDLIADHLERTVSTLADHVVASDEESLGWVLRNDWLPDGKTPLLLGAEPGVRAGGSVNAWPELYREIACHDDGVASLAEVGSSPSAEEPLDRPLVTVAIPHYNRPEFLSQAIASIQAQTYPAIELIVVDDCSDSPEALAALEEVEEKLKGMGGRLVRHASNRYLGAARNTAAAHARGEFIMFLDDDDYAKPHQVETLVRVAEKTASDVVNSFCDRFGGDAPPESGQVSEERWLMLGKAVALGVFRNFFGPASALIRKRQFYEIGGFTEHHGVGHEDWEFFARAALMGMRLELVPEALFWYRQTPNSMIQSINFFHSHARNIAPYLERAPTYQKTVLQFAVGLEQKQTAVVDELNSAVDQRNRTAEENHRLNAILSERQTEVEGLRVVLSERQAEVEGLRVAVSERQAEVEGLSAEIADMRQVLAVMLPVGAATPKQAIECVERSHSWRVTRPLRKLRTYIKGGGDLPDPNTFAQAALQIFWMQRSLSWDIAAPIRIAGRLTRTVVRRSGWYRVSDLTRQRVFPRIRSLIPPTGRPKATTVPAYEQWVRQFDTLSDEDRIAIRRHIGTFKIEPGFSILMPVYNPSPVFLRKAIESVRRQLYPHWELCIADDASTDPDVVSMLDAYAARDPRIKLKRRERNGHISAASNSALSLAEGDFAALLDQDDELPEHALYWMAAEIERRPELKLIYSDEDKIDDCERRHDPYFKPDWNPDLLLGQNFVCHLSAYHRERLVAIGGFREGFEGSQDWDLVLRFSEGLDPSEICHIPAILYHWRVHDESTAASIGSKPYALMAGKRAVTEHLTRQGDVATLEEACGGGFFLPRFAIDDNPLVSILIPTRDHAGVLRQCIESLAKTRYANYEIVVIDNQSVEDETLGYLRELENRGVAHVLRYDQPFNFAALHNWAVAQTRGDYLCLLNNDTEVIASDWLGDLLALAQRPGVGAVGAKLLYPDDTVQHAGVVTGIGGIAGHVHKYAVDNFTGYFSRSVLLQNFSAVTAACLLVSRQAWQRVQGMNEELQVAFNDVDFCLKLREAGLRNVWSPTALLYHHESKSRGPDTVPHKLRRFALEHAYMQWRWGNVLSCDPAYNPNLTLVAEDFSLAWPPRRLRPWADDFRVVDVPYGVSLQPAQPLHIEANGSRVGEFRLPPDLRGRLRGLALMLGTHAGKSCGVLAVRAVSDDGHEASGQVMIGESTPDNALVQILFSEDGLALHGQDRLCYEVTWREADRAIVLWGYPLSERWGHRMDSHPDWAARIQLLVSS